MTVYTTDQVAALLHISSKTVRNLVKAKLLKPLPGIRNIRISEDAIKRYTGLKSIPAHNRAS